MSLELVFKKLCRRPLTAHKIALEAQVHVPLRNRGNPPDRVQVRELLVRAGELVQVHPQMAAQLSHGENTAVSDSRAGGNNSEVQIGDLERVAQCGGQILARASFHKRRRRVCRTPGAATGEKE